LSLKSHLDADHCVGRACLPIQGHCLLVALILDAVAVIPSVHVGLRSTQRSGSPTLVR
jgi:hypothetical protein